MYPAPFRYHRPDNLSDALSLLAKLGEDAKPLSGGQTLIPMLKLRMGDVTDLVDIGRLPGLSAIDIGADEVRIGALATHANIAKSEMAERVPAVRDCASGIADAQVRARGTIGGSISTGDPSTDWPPLLHVLDATVEIAGQSSSREVSIRDFIVDAYSTVLQPGELVTAIRFPLPGENSGGAYIGYKRAAPAYPSASVGVQLTLDANGSCSAVRCVLGASASKPVTSSEAEAALTGKSITRSDLELAADLIINKSDPPADVRGSVEFKRGMLKKLFLQAGEKALLRARGEKLDGSHNYV